MRVRVSPSLQFKFKNMTLIWLIYYTVKIIKKKDTKEDALLVMPCLVLDGLIAGILS